MESFRDVDLSTISTKKELIKILKHAGIKFPMRLKKDELFFYANDVQNAEDDPGMISYGSGVNFVPELTFERTEITEMDDLKSDMDEYGYSVVRLLPEDEALEKREMLLNLVSHIAEDFDPEDSSTWTTGKMPVRTHGILKGKVSNTSEMWDLRLDPRIVKPFEELYLTDDLLVSLDTFNCSPCKRKPDKNPWFHNDMPNKRLLRDNRDCYQMVLNLTEEKDVDEANPGTILVIPDDYKSHYEEMSEKAPYLGYGWGTLATSNFEDVSFVVPIVPLGCALIWDSKIFHMGYSGVSNNPELRVAAYLSYQPRSYANKEDLKKRIKIFEKGEGTGHWCFGPWLQPSIAPRSYGRTNLLNYNDLELFQPDELAERMIGY